MTDSEYEAIVDRRVQARLRTDLTYRNAESSEAQAQREAEITAPVEAELAFRNDDTSALRKAFG